MLQRCFAHAPVRVIYNASQTLISLEPVRPTWLSSLQRRSLDPAHGPVRVWLNGLQNLTLIYFEGRGFSPPVSSAWHSSLLSGRGDPARLGHSCFRGLG